MASEVRVCCFFFFFLPRASLGQPSHRCPWCPRRLWCLLRLDCARLRKSLKWRWPIRAWSDGRNVCCPSQTLVGCRVTLTTKNKNEASRNRDFGDDRPISESKKKKR